MCARLPVGHAAPQAISVVHLWSHVSVADRIAPAVTGMRNLKGSNPTAWLSGRPFEFFSLGYGTLLGAHARSGDAAP
jgi:hypothetical protein